MNCKQQASTSSSESGFTIIESLVALLVVAILLTAIAPVILLSVATRLQAKRIEQATQTTKTFIDGVRTGAIPPPQTNLIELDPATKDKPRNLEDNLITIQKMPAPTTPNGLYCANKDGNILNPNPNCSSDLFFIQAAQIKVKNSIASEGYRLAIRIYRKEAFDSPGVLTASSGENKTIQTPFTSGLGGSKAPLVEMATDISSNATTFQSLCNRLGVASNENCN
jgi:prepilin-type N-terminal cleavage/methylation domain-containing protein